MGATKIAGFLGSVALLALAAASPASADMVRIYQTNSGGDDVNVIDPATNKTVGHLKGIEAAHGVTGSPDGSKIYVTNESESTVDVYDAKTYALVKKVKLSGHPNNLAVAKDGRIAYFDVQFDQTGFEHLPILSYSAKYASAMRF